MIRYSPKLILVVASALGAAQFALAQSAPPAGDRPAVTDFGQDAPGRTTRRGGRRGGGGPIDLDRRVGERRDGDRRGGDRRSDDWRDRDRHDNDRRDDDRHDRRFDGPRDPRAGSGQYPAGANAAGPQQGYGGYGGGCNGCSFGGDGQAPVYKPAPRQAPHGVEINGIWYY